MHLASRSSTASADERCHSPPQWSRRLGDAFRYSRVEDDRPARIGLHNDRERDTCDLEGNIADGGGGKNIEACQAIAEALYGLILRRFLLLVRCMMFVLMANVQRLMRHRVGVTAQGTGIGRGKAQCGTFQHPAQEGE